jgi:hypothetical protein
MGAGCVSPAATPVATSPAPAPVTAPVAEPATMAAFEPALDAEADAEWPTYVDPNGQYEFSHPPYTEVRASQDGKTFEVFTKQTPPVDGPPDVVGKYENGRADIKVWENLSVEYYDTLVKSFMKLK